MVYRTLLINRLENFNNIDLDNIYEYDNVKTVKELKQQLTTKHVYVRDTLEILYHGEVLDDNFNLNNAVLPNDLLICCYQNKPEIIETSTPHINSDNTTNIDNMYTNLLNVLQQGLTNYSASESEDDTPVINSNSFNLSNIISNLTTDSNNFLNIDNNLENNLNDTDNENSDSELEEDNSISEENSLDSSINSTSSVLNNLFNNISSNTFSDTRYSDELQQLQNMGFNNRYRNIEALEITSGNIEQAVNILISNV